jgi:hypothetical protein
MPQSHSPSLLNRLRRAALPRVLILVAALLASQNALACAFEGLIEFQGLEVVAQTDEAAGEACCNLCPDCASCGVCHTSAVSPRGAGSQPAALYVMYSKITFATAAPALWTPPALLRPPIEAA